MPVTSLSSIGRGGGGLLTSPQRRIPSVVPAAAASGSAVIPTNSLYSHWDFSLLSDTENTRYSTDGVAITNAFGTNIGAVATTPQMRYRYTLYDPNQYAEILKSQTSTGLKALYLPVRTGSVNYGGFLQSDGNAFSNITSSASSYTWIAVYKHYGINGWNRTYRWYLNAYNYDFNHGVWWHNNSNTEVDPINYSSVQRYHGNSVPAADRSNSTYVHYEAVNITGNTYSATYSKSDGTFAITSGTFGGSAFYGSTLDSTRVFQIRPTNYAFNSYYPGVLACEFAFYNRSMDSGERQTTLAALKTKWGST